MQIPEIVKVSVSVPLPDKVITDVPISNEFVLSETVDLNLVDMLELEFWNEIFQSSKEIIEKELVYLMLKNQNLELNAHNTTLMLNRIFKSEHKRILLKDNFYQRNYFRNFKLC
jgi:hypothetical protein